VESRNERRALPAGGDVAAPEIRHHREPRALGHARRVVELQRPAALGTMPQGLPVHAGGQHVGAAQLRGGQRLGDRVGIELGEHVGGRAGARQLVRPRRLQREQFVAQHGRKSEVGGAERLARLAARGRKIGDDGIDAV